MAEIIRAEHAGFCFGVKQAMDRTQQQIDQRVSGRRIFTCGPLIHNRRVTDDLERQGVTIIEQLSEARPGDVVIVRSHGEGKAFFEEADSRGLTVVNATCPFVDRIHQLVFDAYNEGKHIVIVGDQSHPEVRGIDGWCANTATVIGTREDAEKAASDLASAFLVCQTTIKKELLEEIISVFEEKRIPVEVHNTICDATRKRQQACSELSKTVDAMVIIGGKKQLQYAKIVRNFQKKL